MSAISDARSDAHPDHIGTVRNALAHYHSGVQAAARHLTSRRASTAPLPVPLTLPEADEAFTRFTDVTDLVLTRLDEELYLLDLMRSPGTRTTKAFASLTMVARAVDHIRRTGERVVFLTPTSGNKGSALRDAVARAYATGFASPDELRVVMVAPAASTSKLRGGPLSEDSALRGANPVALADVDTPAGVKDLAKEVVDAYADEALAGTGFRCWYTLDLDNYRVADSVRAFAEAELLPLGPDSPPRWHAHAVSSAYGLLGYHLGHQVLADGLYPKLAAPARHPGFFLVQQLATPDMVVSALGRGVPGYTRDPAAGVWRRTGDDPAFPEVTDDPAEVLDPTFYTKNPVTSADIDPLIGRHGGGGVVVSRRECLDRFDRVRELAARAGVAIDGDPARIREWSLIKVLTGILVARERGLVPSGTQILAHASGYYTDETIPPLPVEHTEPVRTAPELAKVLTAAVCA
ncbi:hypothetical protein GCM10010252_62660 [Streptomyces aureoverticillatus]|nr:hypothetical protein GCM10010252_62660 [Streptomyces aureoverticillatus]